GGLVHADGEQGGAVVGPYQAAVCLIEGKLGGVAAGQMLQIERVFLVALPIQTVGQPLVIRTDREVAQLQEAVPGFQVQVQKQLFGGGVGFQTAVCRTRAAVVAGIFSARLGTPVVQPGTPHRRQGQVGFADASAYLLEQLRAAVVMDRKSDVEGESLL